MQIKGHANQEVRLSLVLRESNRLLARLALNVIDARQLASDLQDNIQEASDALGALRKAWSAGGHRIGTAAHAKELLRITTRPWADDSSPLRL